MKSILNKRFYLNVPVKDGTCKKEIVYTLNDLPVFPEVYKTKIKKRSKKNINYIIDFFMTFDIETTTMSLNDEYTAFMYQWQCCFNNYVIFGKTWEEFLKLISLLQDFYELNYNKRIVCYIHNLAYEFQFMKDFFDIEDLFAKDKRKPLYFYASGIEFRCSYFLSNMNLQKFCENSELCEHFKLSGENYNYKKIRTISTEMTEEEYSYCFNDVKGLYECVETRLLDDDLTTIPMTSTGYVRRAYRNSMNNKKCRALFEKCRLTPDVYKMLRKAFRGGDAHANRYFVGYIIENVKSKDKQSSYPASMMLYYYPVSAFTYVSPRNQREFDEMINSQCCLMTVTIYDLVSKINQPNPYIDLAHCERFSNIINDNGRILQASLVTITITELDLQCIKMCYDYSNLKVDKMYIAKRGKLPFELRNYLMTLYKSKTELKGISGKEYEYAKKKNEVNSSFGMMVSAIDHDSISYNCNADYNERWKSKKCDLEKALDDYYKSRNNFLSYQWGVWITAHSRYQLRLMITAVGNDFCYCDTDSVKYIGEHEEDFKKINEQIIRECYQSQPHAFAVRDSNNFYLGVWEDDGIYKKFRTWGAKKYAYEDDKGLHITVAGMSKKLGAKAIGSIENFKITGEPIENVGRQIAYYNECSPHKITINGDTFLTASNIALVDTSYTLGVSNTFRELLEKNFKEIYEKGIDKL